jgi:hypothetical protein
MCNDPIDLGLLAAYWLGELPAADEAPLEEHFFGCAHCARRLEELAALSAGVRAAVQDGKVSLIVSARFVEAMQQAGLRLRQYRVEPGGSVNCTIRADDDAVISRLQASLAGVKRIDFVREQVGGPQTRLADVPFDPQAGEVLVIPSPSWLKATPAFTMRMRLIAVDETGDRPIGEYTFNHAPS